MDAGCTHVECIAFQGLYAIDVLVNNRHGFLPVVAKALMK
jgi:hypothetical protein